MKIRSTTTVSAGRRHGKMSHREDGDDVCVKRIGWERGTECLGR